MAASVAYCRHDNAQSTDVVQFSQYIGTPFFSGIMRDLVRRKKTQSWKRMEKIYCFAESLPHVIQTAGYQVLEKSCCPLSESLIPPTRLVTPSSALPSTPGLKYLCFLSLDSSSHCKSMRRRLLRHTCMHPCTSLHMFSCISLYTSTYLHSSLHSYLYLKTNSHT